MALITSTDTRSGRAAATMQKVRDLGPVLPLAALTVGVLLVACIMAGTIVPVALALLIGHVGFHAHQRDRALNRRR